MTADLVMRTCGLGKAYRIWRRPEDRLKQVLFPRRRYYQDYWALKDVNLELRRGEAVGIVGRNGAGKTTFLELAYGTLEPTIGTIERFGRFTGMLELGAGFNPEFTGRENVLLSALAIGLTEAQIKERLPAIAEFAGIGEFLEMPVKTYSSGMYARLAFAISAHVDADVLIVDEILSVGDIAFAQKCMRFIRAFRSRGTLLFVSHSPDSVMNLCDRAVWLDSGEVRAIGTAKDICRDYVATIEGSKDNAPSFNIGGRRRTDSPAAEWRTPTTTTPAELRIFSFDPDGPWHGRRGGSILNVRVLDGAGEPIELPGSGDEVIVEVNCQAHSRLHGAIVGFQVRDRLGQAIFGDNTFLTYRDSPISVMPGERIMARFRFRLPHLSDGEYCINAALAEGTQEEHVQHHWLDEAVVLTVRRSHTRLGLVGIPMLGIEIEKIDGAASSEADVAE